MWFLAKILQRYWNADSSWLVFPHCSGPHLIRLFSLLRCRLPSRVTLRQPPSLSSFVQLSDRRSLPTSGHAEISSQKPFVWFRTKTDKGIICLADHLHSVSKACWEEKGRKKKLTALLLSTYDVWHKKSFQYPQKKLVIHFYCIFFSFKKGAFFQLNISFSRLNGDWVTPSWISSLVFGAA